MSARLPGPNATFVAALHTLLAKEYGIDPEDKDERRYLLRDVITDCRHYADQNNIEFLDVLASSYDVYIEEKAQLSD